MSRPPAVHGLSLLAALAGAALVLAGCSAGSGGRLETGYRYRPLNSTSVERRAFYSDPYSVEARLADTGGDDTNPRQRNRQLNERR